MSMTDRELLEMAAKAVGRTFSGGQWNYPGLHYLGGNAWNPLEDDGDALRLAVTLNMRVDLCGDVAIVEALNGPGPVSEPSDYRRAIVRAAAEIGKDMQTGS